MYKEIRRKRISSALAAIAFAMLFLLPVAAPLMSSVGETRGVDNFTVTMASADTPASVVHSGIWHLFNVTFDSTPEDVQLILKKNDTYRDDGTTEGTDKTNYYRWVYSNNEWHGLWLEDGNKSYNNTAGINLNRYVYLDVDRCGVDTFTNTYSFFGGVDSQISGEWIYTVYSGVNQVTKGFISIERTNIGISVQNPPMVAKVEPDTEMTVNVTDANGLIAPTIIRNIGNIPITPVANFFEFDRYFTYSFDKEVLAPGESATGHFILTSDKWPPSKTQVNYEITGKGQEEIASAGANSFFFEIPGVGNDLYIQVGHSHLLQQIILGGELVFHYPYTLTVYEYESVTFKAYVYSRKDTSASFVVDFSSGQPALAPAEMDSLSAGSSDSLDLKTMPLNLKKGEEIEIEMTVTAKLGPPTIRAFNVNYDIRVDGYSFADYYTAIAVLQPKSEETIIPGSSSGFMVFIFIIVLLGSYMAFSIMNNRREI